MSPGTPVRLRLVNTDSFAAAASRSTGTPFRVLAIDGNDLNGPGALERVHARARGRRSLRHRLHACRRAAVRVALEGTDAALVLERRRPAAPADDRRDRRPTSTRSTTAGPRRRRSTRRAASTALPLTITTKPGFFDGRPGRQWAINGGIFPDVPMFVVEDGDLVERRRSRTTRTSSTRCTCTATTCSSSAGTASRPRAARGGRTR